MQYVTKEQMEMVQYILRQVALVEDEDWWDQFDLLPFLKMCRKFEVKEVVDEVMKRLDEEKE